MPSLLQAHPQWDPNWLKLFLYYFSLLARSPPHLTPGPTSFVELAFDISSLFGRLCHGIFNHLEMFPFQAQSSTPIGASATTTYCFHPTKVECFRNRTCVTWRLCSQTLQVAPDASPGGFRKHRAVLQSSPDQFKEDHALVCASFVVESRLSRRSLAHSHPAESSLRTVPWIVLWVCLILPNRFNFQRTSLLVSVDSDPRTRPSYCLEYGIPCIHVQRILYSS